MTRPFNEVYFKELTISFNTFIWHLNKLKIYSLYAACKSGNLNKKVLTECLVNCKISKSFP
jgi:hypothetical protein